MRIAILETGAPPSPVRERHPGYGEMMVEMLAPLMPGADFAVARVFDGDETPETQNVDGYLITGSPAGVYEDHDWIAPLFETIRAAAATRTPQVGICFGHQAIAAALGGRVEKSEKGWGVGVHRYRVHNESAWMDPITQEISCAVSHQDQVVEAPAGARVLAGSEFCPNGALAYAQGPAVSFQMHPEFEHGFASDLLAARRDRIPGDRVADGLQSLRADSGRATLARWIAAFYQTA
ncbi:MAG: type 1 glutamine amidotransferase [Pseudomonadota bacterium]